MLMKFLQGTASEVTPIRSIDDQLISNGDPGPITLKLRRYYMDIVLAKIEVLTNGYTNQ